MRLSALREQDKDNKTGTFQPQAIPIVQVPSPVSSSNKETVKKDFNGNWRQVNATVIGDHEIPDRTAMHIPVSVPNTIVGCDICLEGASYVKRLAVESTLNTVREGHKTVAFVVNTTGGPVKIKHEVLLSKVLAYYMRVIPEPMEFPRACVASVGQLPCDSERGSDPTLRLLVSVVDYPELKQSLMTLLGRYREVIALPGEPLDATDKAEHNIKLKPGVQPIYIPAYHLPHSQRQILDEQIKDMLEQGVIQHSASPWNSPLFLVPKKDGQYRPVIDFRRVNQVTEDDRYPLPVLQDLL